MIVIPPITVSSEKIVSSSIAEPSSGEVVWSAATGYAYPQKVYRAETHKIYQSLSATSTVDSTTPELSIFSSTPKWAEVASTNRFAMFDTKNNIPSYATNSITVSVKPGQRIDALALLGMENVSNILVTATYPAGTTTIENKDNSYTVNGTTSYYKNYLKLDLIPYYDVTINITLTGTGTIKLNQFIIGIYENIGSTQRGISADVINFSTVDRDLYGNASLVQRRNVPKISVNLMLDKTRVNKVAKVREYLNAKPAVWSGLDQTVQDDYYDSLLILGFYKTFNINIDNPIIVSVSLELEEI